MVALVLRRANVFRKGGHWDDDDYDAFDGHWRVGRMSSGQTNLSRNLVAKKPCRNLKIDLRSKRGMDVAVGAECRPRPPGSSGGTGSGDRGRCLSVGGKGGLIITHRLQKTSIL
jgi:hypothetical protein